MKKYEYKDKLYQILGNGKMRENGEWVDCIIYTPLYETNSKYFVRTEREFFEKFKPYKTN